MPLSVNDLNYFYMTGTPFEVQALKDVCLTIEDGEFVGIIGHTGCGKSTLIRHQTGYFCKWGREKDSPNLNRNFENDQLTGYARSR